MTRLFFAALIVYALLITVYAISMTVLYHQMFRMDRMTHVAAEQVELRQRMDRDDKMRGPEPKWFDLLPHERNAMGAGMIDSCKWPLTDNWESPFIIKGGTQ